MDTEKYRTGLKRIWAAIVDGIVFMPFWFVDRWIINNTTDNYVIVAWQVLIVFIPIFYSIILHYMYGQTIGKWVAGVKVLDISEKRTINLKQSFLRDGFYLLVEVAGLIYFIIMVVRTNDIQYLLHDFNDFARTPFFVWTVLELVTMLINAKRRAIHDFLAKSVVVRTQ